jgi:hypothetical protein
MAHGTAPGTRQEAPGTDALHLRATPAFRRGVLLASLLVVLLEIVLFAFLWRLGALVDPGSDPRAAAVFVALGTAVTLQAMAVVGVLWVLVAMAWTALRSDVVGWALEHPWRSWQGRPTDVGRAWRQGGWLVLELRGHWRRWYVRAGRDQDATTEALRRQLSDDAWLSRADARAHLARTVLPAVLAAAGLGALALLWALRALGGLMHRP